MTLLWLLRRCRVQGCTGLFPPLSTRQPAGSKGAQVCFLPYLPDSLPGPRVHRSVSCPRYRQPAGSVGAQVCFLPYLSRQPAGSKGAQVCFLPSLQTACRVSGCTGLFPPLSTRQPAGSKGAQVCFFPSLQTACRVSGCTGLFPPLSTRQPARSVGAQVCFFPYLPDSLPGQWVHRSVSSLIYQTACQVNGCTGLFLPLSTRQPARSVGAQVCFFPSLQTACQVSGCTGLFLPLATDSLSSLWVHRSVSSPRYRQPVESVGAQVCFFPSLQTACRVCGCTGLFLPLATDSLSSLWVHRSVSSPRYQTARTVSTTKLVQRVDVSFSLSPPSPSLATRQPVLSALA